jgi:hypothetical protein
LFLQGLDVDVVLFYRKLRYATHTVTHNLTPAAFIVKLNVLHINSNKLLSTKAKNLRFICVICVLNKSWA